MKIKFSDGSQSSWSMDQLLRKLNIMKMTNSLLLAFALALLGCGPNVERQRSGTGTNVVLGEICPEQVFSEFPVLKPVTPVEYGRKPVDLYAHDYFIYYESSAAYVDITNSIFRHLKASHYKLIDADESRKSFQFQDGEKRWRVGFRDLFGSNTVVSAGYYY